VFLIRYYPRGGSSPLVRGSVSGEACALALGRFIPARAGIGLLACWVSGWWPVHPRSCGDRDGFEVEEIGLTGSSPLVRGSVYRR